MGTAFGSQAPGPDSSTVSSVQTGRDYNLANAVKLPGFAQPLSDPDEAWNVESLAQLGGVSRAVALQGDYAYVAQQQSVAVLDVGDPDQPVLVGQTSILPYPPNDLTVAGSFVYVADGWQGGLVIFDVSDPAAPLEVGSYDTPSDAHGVSVVGQYAYVADWDSGLRIIDVSAPGSPVEVGALHTSGLASDVVVYGDYAYVTLGSEGLAVVDVSDPYSPVQVGAHDTPVLALEIEVAGDFAYIADWTGGLRIIDVSNPQAPFEAGFLDTPGLAHALDIEGHLAYVADGVSPSSLRIIDVSNPSAPFEVAARSTPYWASDVAVAGDRAFVACWSGGLVIYDVSTPSAPYQSGTYDTVTFAIDVAVSASYAYVADSWGLHIIDISNPSAPSEAGSYSSLASVNGVAISDGYAYLAAGSSGLRIIDVADPQSPFQVGFQAIPGEANGVTVSGGYAYVAGGTGGLRIIDVSNPGAPFEAGHYDTPGYAWSVAISGSLAYVADDGSGLRIVDVSNPGVPTERGFYSTSGTLHAVAVDGAYAYAGGDLTGLRIIDVSRPDQPSEVGSSDQGDTPWLGYIRDIVASGGRVYVASNDLPPADPSFGELHVVDVSCPGAPFALGNYQTYGGQQGVALASGRVHVAAGEAGYFILDLADATHSICGRATDGHRNPLPGAFFGLLKDGDPTYAQTTHANSTGSFVIRDIADAGSYTVRAILRDESGTTRVHYGPYGLLTSVDTPSFPIQPDGGTTVKNISFSDPSLISEIPYDRRGDLATMFYHTQQVNSFVTDTLGEEDFQPVDRIWAYSPLKPYDCRAPVYYCPSTFDPDICPYARMVSVHEQASAWADLNRPMAREWHESFHHVMNDLLTVPEYVQCDSGVCKEDDCQRGTCTGGDCNHWGFDNPSTKDSWVEGWAEFWPCVLWDTLGYSKPYVFRMNWQSISIEDNILLWERYPTGASLEEFSVASLLWDLYDGKDSWDDDNIDLSLDTLWNVLKLATPEVVTNTRDLYDLLWFDSSLVNEDGTPVNGWDIDEIFIAHGFYADDGDHWWEPGEEVGWGGVPYRRSTFEIPNAYFRVDVQNEDGQPVEGAHCEVDIHFPDNHYDFSYSVDLPESEGNLIGLGLPTTRTVASADLTVTWVGGSSEPYSIDNETYWTAVLTSTTGYAAEHTFIVPGAPIFLPLVVRKP